MDTILAEFHREVDMLEKCVHILQGLRTTGPLTPAQVTALPDGIKNAVEISMSDPRLTSGVLDSLLILLVSRHEFFIREIFKKLCDQAYCGIAANQISENVKKHIISKSVDVIRQEKKYGIGSAQKFSIFSNIAKLGNDSEVITDINADCLVLTKQIDSDELKSLFKDLCSTDIWKIVSQQAGFRQYFMGVDENSAMTQGKAKLDEIISRRNEITHPNGPLFSMVLSAESLLEMMKFLKVLSTDVKNFCSMEVVAINASRQAQPI